VSSLGGGLREVVTYEILLEYSNCRDPRANADAVFSKRQLKVNFEKKNPVLPIEKFPFLVLARDTIMLQHLIIHFSPHYLSRRLRREVVAYERFQIW